MKLLEITEYMSDYEKSLIEEYNKNINLSLFLIEGHTVDELLLRNREILNELNELDTFNEEVFFEMANFEKEISGLSLDIWIDEAGEDRPNKHHLPRVKIKDPNDSKSFISISISKEPKILAGKFVKPTNLKDIFKFIKTNYDDLMDVWNKKISARKFMDLHRIDKGGKE